MRVFKPNFPFVVAFKLLKPSYSNSKGVVSKTFTESEDIYNCSFKTYGGTETANNDLYTIVDTANVETWYSPEITSECRIKVLSTGKTYEIFGDVENIDMRNQFLKFKVRAVQGGA